jgi:hypothetical protein
MKKKVNEEKTLKHAVAFTFHNATNVRFSIDNKIYEYINTVHDHKSMNGANTVAVLYDYNKTRYMAVDVDHERIGSKEITIL